LKIKPAVIDESSAVGFWEISTLVRGGDQLCRYGRFRSLVEKLEGIIIGVDEGITHIRPDQDKWSLKEIIGHLIDSASNNHQRFVRLQLGDLNYFRLMTRTSGSPPKNITICNGRRSQHSGAVTTGYC
jgi:hypothetical protein